jgi:diguanylate cyclase (GGDEF)-like protein
MSRDANDTNRVGNRTLTVFYKIRDKIMSRDANDIEKVSSHTLTMAYIGALSLIAIFTYGSHLVTSNIMAKQKETTEISYVLGKQRAIVQQISFHAANYFNHGSDVDKIFLGNAITEMERSQEYLKDILYDLGLLDRIAGNETVSEMLYDTYYEAPFYLNRQIGSFLENAHKFSEMERRDKGRERKRSLDAISKKYTDHLMPAMDAALSRYQKESLEKIAYYYRVQWMSTVFIIIVLALEAALIFKPLVARVQKYNVLLLKQALQDELTGLKNRRAFMMQAEKALQNAVEKKRPITFALVDLDKFKLVNDNYGHDVGDKVLQHFARILTHSLRPPDIVGRVGGEEFAIVLQGSDLKTAYDVLDRLRLKTEKTPCRYDDAEGQERGLDYTSSMGMISLVPDEGDDVATLMKHADEALYASKEGGRNCLTVSELSVDAVVPAAEPENVSVTP